MPRDILNTWRCPVCGQPKTYLKEITDKEFTNKKIAYDKVYPIRPEAEDKPVGERTVTDFRDIAREHLSDICAVNKVCDGHPDRLCMGQKYGKAIGFGGAGQGRTFTANFEALEKYKFKMKKIQLLILIHFSQRVNEKEINNFNICTFF